jgi:hypothetical protein
MEPSLGLQNQPALPAHFWQAQISYQYGSTNQFYVGSERNDAAGPFGVPPHRQTNILLLDVLYGVTNRMAANVTVPFVWSSGGVEQGTAASHQFVETSSSGVGDIALEMDYWLSNPEKPGNWNASVGFGFKAPTGSDSVTAINYNRNPPQETPVDEAFQLGSGGWHMLFRAQGTLRVSGPFFGYASGFYSLSLNARSDVIQGGTLRAVPDVYSGRLGGAYLLPFLDGFVFTAGGRVNGITVRDVIGGGDLYFRRPGYEVYVEPGLTWTRGVNSATVSVPIRVYQNKLDSLLDASEKRHTGADFAPYLVIASFARRF